MTIPSLSIFYCQQILTLRNYDTQDNNTSNTVTSPHNLNTTRKDELPHKNLTVACNPSDRKSNYDTQDTNTSNTVTSPHNLKTTRKDELPHKNLTVTRNSSDRKSKSNINVAPISTIIRDSMLQKVFGDKLPNSLSNNHHVVVRSFGGAKTQCMEDHIKPTIKLSPNQIIIHCGTNNLPSNEESKIIADNTNNLLQKAKSDVHKVAISGSSFPSKQFAIDNYKIFRRDTNCFGGGLMFYVNENIPCRKLSPEQNDSNFEIIFLEITLRNRKWLLIGLYKLPGQKKRFS